MNLIIDAGNTRIKLAVFDRQEMVHLRSMPDWSEPVFFEVTQKFPAIRAALTCSVREVPEWLPSFFAEKDVPLTDLTHRLGLPIRIVYGSPETLGKDRIAAAAGAAAAYPGKPVLSIDAGTALTIDLVTADGIFLGGNISPGLRMRFAALHEQTFSLPLIEPADDVPLIGTDTAGAILAGVVNGMVYEIDNSINSLKNKYNDLQPILTGGDASYLAGRLKNSIFVNQNLVLNGLNIILMHVMQNMEGPGSER